MRLLLLISGLLLVACGDNSGGPDGSMIDSQIPDAHQYKRDRGTVTPTDMGPPADLPLPDKGIPKDKALPDQGGGALKTHTAPIKLTFDTNNGGLVGNKDWDWKAQINFKSDSNCTSTPVTPPTAGHSGKGMWGTRVNGCHSAQNPKNDATNSGGTTPKCTNTKLTDDMVLRFKVSIPSTWTLVDLVFWQWTDLNYPWDWNEVRVDDGSGPVYVKNGTLSQSQYCLGTVTKPTGWVKQTFWLDDYKGKTVTISFHFMASTTSNKAGWYIDDLEVKKN